MKAIEGGKNGDHSLQTTQRDQRTFYRKVLLIQLGKDVDRAPRKLPENDSRRQSLGNKGAVLLVDDDQSTLEFGSVVL